MIDIKTHNQLLADAKFRQAFEVLPKGKKFRDLSTIIVLPTRGVSQDKKEIVCKCGRKHEYVETNANGLSPIFVEAFKRLVKPMNVPIIEMMVSGMEVGEAYSRTIETILANPVLAKYKYILTVEDDNIIPHMPGTQGPLMMLYEDMEKGYDAVGGLYWTKGEPSMPLLYGTPKEKREKPAGMFKVRFPAKRQDPKRWGKVNKDGKDWHDGEIVECNGMGMGFTLFKLDLFKDPKLAKPWFETIQDHGTKDKPGIRQYTQDLNFFEKFRERGYKCAVDTRIKVGHLDIRSGIIY
jgi:hypothetical protein